jgi:hypothetical protein
MAMNEVAIKEIPIPQINAAKVKTGNSLQLYILEIQSFLVGYSAGSQVGLLNAMSDTKNAGLELATMGALLAYYHYQNCVAPSAHYAQGPAIYAISAYSFVNAFY